MEESYAVCPERNSDDALRRFYGSGYPNPRWREVARSALRHRLTGGLIVAMNAGGALFYVWGFF